jgi:3-oxoacyl-[acyl-carrier protein] reductase
MELELKNKVVLVTGGTRGIGKAVALKAAKEGAGVAVCGRTQATLDETVAELKALGVPAFGKALDLMAPGTLEAFVDETVRALGRLDGVVANAGGTFGKDFKDATAEEWVKTLELNLVHAVRVIKAAVPHLAKSGEGAVVIIASISGFKPGPRSQYGAAKAGEIQLAASLARELAPERIRLNAVSPGSIMFEGGRWAERLATHPEKIRDFIAKEFPWGRMGTLEEVSDVVTFLLSKRASWVNGTNVVVDGAQGNPSVRL